MPQLPPHPILSIELLISGERFPFWDILTEERREKSKWSCTTWPSSYLYLFRVVRLCKIVLASYLRTTVSAYHFFFPVALNILIVLCFLMYLSSGCQRRRCVFETHSTWRVSWDPQLHMAGNGRKGMGCSAGSYLGGPIMRHWDWCCMEGNLSCCKSSFFMYIYFEKYE